MIRLVRDLFDVAAARDRVCELAAKYASTREALQRTLVALSDAGTREAALFEKVRQLEEYTTQVELERDDALREAAEVRDAMCWLEGTFLNGTGGVA